MCDPEHVIIEYWNARKAIEFHQHLGSLWASELLFLELLKHFFVKAEDAENKWSPNGESGEKLSSILGAIWGYVAGC